MIKWESRWEIKKQDNQAFSDENTFKRSHDNVCPFYTAVTLNRITINEPINNRTVVFRLSYAAF